MHEAQDMQFSVKHHALLRNLMQKLKTKVCSFFILTTSLNAALIADQTALFIDLHI